LNLSKKNLSLTKWCVPSERHPRMKGIREGKGREGKGREGKRREEKRRGIQ
jgi:hypothetical protein